MKTYIFLKKHLLIFFLFLVSSTVFSQGILQVLDSKNNNVARNSVTDYGDINLNSSKVFNFNLKNIASGKGKKGLKKVTVSISGNDFSVTNSNFGNLKKGTQVTLPIKFSPSSEGLKTAVVTVSYNNGVQSSYKFTLQGKASASAVQSIGVFGNSLSINDNDNTPNTSDFTNFGTASSRIFYVGNTQGTGNTTLTVTSITLSNTTDFSISSGLADNTIGKNNSSPFTISLKSSSCGDVTSTVTIVSDAGNDGSDNRWIFTISSKKEPEIDILRGGTAIVNGTTDNPSNFLNVGVGSSTSVTYTVENNGGCDLDLSAFSLTNSTDFTLIATDPSTVIAGGNTTFTVAFHPTTGGTLSSIVSIINNDSNEDPYTFTVQGTSTEPLTEGPGGVTNDLALWLKADEGVTKNGTDGVTTWATQGRGSNATVNTPGQEPTFRDDAAYNVNFNPVVDFDNNYETIPLDNDYSYDDTSTQFLEGSSGFYTEEIFVVLIPDVAVNNTFGGMDIFCADELPGTNQTDATGIGLGSYSVRFSGEILSYAVGTTSNGDGYGVAEAGTGSVYDNVGIINTRNNSAGDEQELYYNANNKRTIQNDLNDFSNVDDSRYWIGRSEGWEASADARIAEIITYSSRKNDTDLTQERNRIQSYLAVKYGITLGANGTSQDYVDSDGTVIWDVDTGVAAEDVFNYDIAGIGRDDASELHQKQSKSVNTFFDGVGESRGLLTIGLSDIHSTNNLNTATFNSDRQFLCWGNNNQPLDGTALSVEVDMSIGIGDATLETKVSFEAIQRVWKVVENGGDIPTVKVSIPTSAVRSAVPPDGRYLMFISDTGVFDPTADYRVMTESGGNLYAEYDFDGTKYITFGWAPEVEKERSIYFNPADQHYIDIENNLDLNPTEFTISAWIKRGVNSANTSILSKRNVGYTEGYDFKIDGSGKVEMSWGAAGVQKITSATTIPVNIWHQVAVIYTGNTAKIYIDGVIDKTVPSLNNPVSTNSSFFIAAACKNTPEAYFHGNIDEVRVWDIALSEDQLRYIMNQEIEENSTFVGGKIIPNTITKNEFTTTLWDKLAGYYPMSVYTYTNTKDASGKGHQGALRNLNTVDWQTAPLPYVSVAATDWSIPTTWNSDSFQTVPGSASIVDSDISVDWNIVELAHNTSMDDSNVPADNLGERRLLYLYIPDGVTLIVPGTTGSDGTGTGYGLNISHYLYLAGKIDLEGESQLVQADRSDLVTSATGELERDQQGVANIYAYNYFGSPVGTGGVNNSFTLSDVLYDGANKVKFIGGYNGALGTPISIANYWIYKYANKSGAYAEWQPMGGTGVINAGEGFTMKGPSPSAIITVNQNYTFKGKPNNGTISLAVSANNEYLVANPYPSAIDVTKFIDDNASSLLTATIYLWEQFEVTSHVLADYQGGYATLTKSGGVQAAAYPGLGGGSAAKTPENYVPVAQGFFTDSDADGGNIVFKNSQRVFVTEASGTSVFMKSSNAKSKTAISTKRDNRQKFRLGFEAPQIGHRQLLLTIDEKATNDVDWGYEGEMYGIVDDDMYWDLADKKYVIQALPDANIDREIPLGIKMGETGIAKILVDALENVDSSKDIYIKDALTGTTTQINNEPFEIELETGEYLDRFSLTFAAQETLSVEDEILENGVHVFMDNTTSEIQIRNTVQAELLSVKLYNSLGQLQSTWNKNLEAVSIALPVNIKSTGMYLVQINTTTGTISKKIIIK